jgi:5-methylcytosine-specific restriction endonuclease McrA
MPAPESRAPRIEPLSPQRYKVQFTADAELKRKIERATNLMRHKNPSGDLSVLMERAVDLLITELEKQRLGKTSRPSKAPRKKTRPGYVPRAVRREVFERDGEQCTFVDETGRRCESRTLLELDHRKARAFGGTDDAENLTVRCRRHNGLSAERDFGRDHVERKKSEKKSASKSHPRQRGYDDETALRALRGLGFKEGEARHALEIVTERWTVGDTPPIETLLREALSVLA